MTAGRPADRCCCRTIVRTVGSVSPRSATPTPRVPRWKPSRRRLSNPTGSTAWPDRRHTVAAGQKRYQLYWGDLHRHTEISSDGGFDGTLWDMYRYALDAAELDFIASTDHYYGADGAMGRPENRGYDWWRTQKLADVFHVRERFMPLFGYERTIRWPYGHRNIINLERGTTAFNRTIASDQENEDSPRQPEELRLWKALQGQDVISIPHTIAAGGGTNFVYNDPAMEPLLEIYQGCRLSYEASGAPRVNSADRHAAGYAQSALGKGYKIGFIASSGPPLDAHLLRGGLRRGAHARGRVPGPPAATRLRRNRQHRRRCPLRRRHHGRFHPHFRASRDPSRRARDRADP